MITHSPVLKRVHDSEQQYYLADDFEILDFFSKSLNRKISIKVPSALLIDGASIPRFFWRIIGHPMMSRFWIAFVIHDYGYGNTNLCSEIKALKRKELELLFYDLLRDQNLGWFKASSMYRAVKSFGWLKFRKSPNKFYIEGGNHV